MGPPTDARSVLFWRLINSTASQHWGNQGRPDVRTVTRRPTSRHSAPVPRGPTADVCSHRFVQGERTAGEAGNSGRCDKPVVPTGLGQRLLPTLPGVSESEKGTMLALPEPIHFDCPR